jgi:hypothetical protein
VSSQQIIRKPHTLLTLLITTLTQYIISGRQFEREHVSFSDVDTFVYVLKLSDMKKGNENISRMLSDDHSKGIAEASNFFIFVDAADASKFFGYSTDSRAVEFAVRAALGESISKLVTRVFVMDSKDARDCNAQVEGAIGDLMKVTRAASTRKDSSESKDHKK